MSPAPRGLLSTARPCEAAGTFPRTRLGPPPGPSPRSAGGDARRPPPAPTRPSRTEPSSVHPVRAPLHHESILFPMAGSSRSRFPRFRGEHRAERLRHRPTPSTPRREGVPPASASPGRRDDHPDRDDVDRERCSDEGQMLRSGARQRGRPGGWVRLPWEPGRDDRCWVPFDSARHVPSSSPLPALSGPRRRAHPGRRARHARAVTAGTPAPFHRKRRRDVPPSSGRSSLLGFSRGP